MVQWYMLASISNELQRQHEDIELRAMLLHLIKFFVEHVELKDMRY